MGHLARGRSREGLGALLRDARRGRPHGPVRHPRPSRPGEGVGQPRAGARRRPAPLLRARDGRDRRVGRRDRGVHGRACASRSARSIPRRRSSRCASRPGGRWRCRATPTCPSSSATSTSARWRCWRAGRGGDRGVRAPQRAAGAARMSAAGSAGTRTASRAAGRWCSGGVEIPGAARGLVGWSDADVLTHAVIDALLGAAGPGRHRPALPGHRRALARRGVDRAAAPGARHAAGPWRTWTRP